MNIQQSVTVNMDDIVRQNVSLMTDKRKTSWPWTLDDPYQQSYFTFSKENWVKVEEHSVTAQRSESITKLALHSWNIDFMLPFPDSRMKTALAELQSLIGGHERHETTANVIFLQECLESDQKVISSNPWVQENFFITDLNNENWASDYYGTLTLIDKRLPISSASRVHFSQTRMERDAFFVDVKIRGRTVRLCNTHLESLALDPPYRPPQMKLASTFMQESSVDASILAGDLNAIQDFDRHLHSDNGLKDAYLELGGSENDPSGHTWGQQASTKLRKQFGTSRMDKAFFCGALRLESFRSFGADVLLENQGERDDIIRLGFDKPWITDHLGIMATFEVMDDKSQRL